MRRERSKVFSDSNGNRTGRFFTGPVHFRAADGSWQEIDTTLVPSELAGYAWRNTADAFSVHFAARASSEDMVQVNDAASSITFGLQGASPLSTAVVDGSKVTYPNVKPGIDLVYEVRNGEVKELIVLQQAPTEPLTLDFPLALHNLTAQEVGSGALDLVTDSGDLGFHLSDVWMVDSSQGSEGGEPAFSEDLTSDLIGPVGDQTLSVTPNQSWLTAPERVYPVVIDPTTTKTTNDDTYVQSNICCTDVSGENEMKSGTFDSGTTKARSLMKFADVQNQIPGGATITGAHLFVYEFHSFSCTPRDVSVHRIDAPWDGNNVRWSNQPAVAAAATTVNVAKGYSASCGAGWVTFTTLGSMVQYWKANNNNYGIEIRSPNETTNDWWKKWRPLGSGNAPYLEVYYTEPNNPPNDPLLNSPSGGTTGPSPTLNATYRDPDSGDSGWVEFEIYQSGMCCGSPFRSGNGNTVNPGNNSTWTPGSSLPSGNYVWRALGNDGQATSGWTSTIAFTVDASIPDPPAITNSPTNPSNNRNPAWSFSGESGATFQCRLMRGGTTVSGWGSCTSPKPFDLTGQPDGTYTFEVTQTDQLGNGPSSSSSSNYILDAAVPSAPSITSSPTTPSKNRNPVWSFSGESGATFQCRLMRGGTTVSGWGSCTSPKPFDLTGQPDGTYTFEVTQTDQLGNGPSSSASSNYTLDTTAPMNPTITNSPSSPSNNLNPTWYFSGESGATFQCRLTRATTTISDWASCTSPKSFNFSGQPDGIYTFEVTQTDQLGNGPSSSASSNYTLDTTAPMNPTITNSPTNPSNNRNPAWSFSGESGATFQCRLMRSGTTIVDWASCSSPKPFDLTGQPDGTYTFEVTQTDQLGNGPSPSSSSNYTLDTSPPNASPVVSLSISPANGNRSTPFTASVSASDPDGDSINGSTYRIEWGDAYSTWAQSGSHKYGAVGGYSVRAYACDQRGACAYSSYSNVQVNWSNTAPVVNLSVSPGAGDLSTSFTASLAGSYDPENDPFFEYETEWGDGAISEGWSVSHRYLKPGTYTVETTVIDEWGLEGSTSRTISVGPGGSVQGSMDCDVTECPPIDTETPSPCEIPGPDAGGYRCDSAKYFWVPGDGTEVGSDWGRAENPIPLPFEFSWYGQPRTDIYATTNGVICFTLDSCTTSWVGPLPSPSEPNDIISCLGEALDNPSVTTKVWGVAPDRVFVLEYSGDHDFYPEQWSINLGGISNSFQIQLWEDGHAACMFEDISDDEDGDPHSVGIEDATGTVGLRYEYGEFTETYNGVRFFPEGNTCDPSCVTLPDECSVYEPCTRSPEPELADPTGLTDNSVRFDLHNTWKPAREILPGGGSFQPDNGKRVYISPGHFSAEKGGSHSFKCLNNETNEWREAWQTGRALRDKLTARNYWVLMPRKAADVGSNRSAFYYDRIHTAYEWWDQQKPGRPSGSFVYITIHSTGTEARERDCTDRHNPRGTFPIWDNAQDEGIARALLNKLEPVTPGHDLKPVDVESMSYSGDDYCTDPKWATNEQPNELCVEGAELMPTGYIEVEWHDSKEGAEWIANNNGRVGQAMAEAVNCFFFTVECN